MNWSRRKLALATVAIFWFVESSVGSSTTEGLPRSRQIPLAKRRHHRPWSLSGLINRDGFLKRLYQRVPGDWEVELRRLPSLPADVFCHVRQVPGDGNCLFHSISLCLEHAVNNTHWDMSASSSTGGCNLDDLYSQSQLLRRKAVACLQQTHRRLFLQGRETLRVHELVQAAAQQYGLEPEEYVMHMQQDSVWGGGPEIVALCNILQRPIHVYELAVNARDDFVLRRMACFGTPRFDRRKALHILSADSRFPDIEAGDQLSQGNHFLAIFPQERVKKRVRGGAELDDENSIRPPALEPPVVFDDSKDDPAEEKLSWWKKVLRVLP